MLDVITYILKWGDSFAKKWVWDRFIRWITPRAFHITSSCSDSAAIARETKKNRLSSSSTIISTSDPVRVYEGFATLDILSNGRAEIVAGRASRISLFSLLGYELENY